EGTKHTKRSPQSSSAVPFQRSSKQIFENRRAKRAWRVNASCPSCLRGSTPCIPFHIAARHSIPRIPPHVGDLDGPAVPRMDHGLLHTQERRCPAPLRRAPGRPCSELPADQAL